MSEQSAKTHQTTINYALPETPYPANYVTRDVCFTCGDYGWCVLILHTPTAEYEPGHLPTCGRCLIEIGALLLARPLEEGRLEGYEIESVSVRRAVGGE